MRLGWSTGDLESFAYTEVENTVLFGGDITGAYWRRPTDRTGLAFVSNGISSDHADYLAAGGLGFLLGDGYLKYARETIVEHYYNVHVWRGLSFAEDIQFIANPGYNSDRGPVWVFSLRGHLEF
jgi:carbohydrate-selective porin OprB